MKVILRKDFVNLGDAGDIKEVSDGYARNYLIPNKIAVRADEGSTKAAVHQKKMIDQKKEKRKSSMLGIAESLNGKEVEIIVKTGENDRLFGSVTHSDVSKAIKNVLNVELDKRKIEFSENVKALGTYQIKIKLADGISAAIQLKVTKQAE